MVTFFFSHHSFIHFILCRVLYYCVPTFYVFKYILATNINNGRERTVLLKTYYVCFDYVILYDIVQNITTNKRADNLVLVYTCHVLGFHYLLFSIKQGDNHHMASYYAIIMKNVSVFLRIVSVCLITFYRDVSILVY